MLGGNGGGTGLHFPPPDLPALLQFVVTALLIACGLLVLLKNFASKYFVVDTSFEEGAGIQVYEDSSSLKSSSSMSIGGGTGGGGGEGNSGHNDSTNRCEEKCFVCGKDGNKVCSECKSVRYCSQDCQSKNWKDHKPNCRKRESDKIALVPARGVYKVLKKQKTILYPYDEFMKLYYWEKKVFPPCGLLNCGNSCFANVVLQCLSCTRPLVGYLLDDNHSRECRRNDWCFFCELQLLIKKVCQSSQPLSAINILSRLPNIGSHLGYGRQEDAHEFMRFAIDTMQSIYLDEFGGEKALDASSQETSIIQYIFGGLLQSQVICMKCNMVSNRYENMMDMTVEIQGDAESLEHCLDQFTAKESLEGENMYRCDGCNDYVKAVKRLTVHQAPNILTVTLKRFQSGRFGKLNKRVAFPETLDLGPYMSSPGNGDNLYALYAVVVHLDMLNASFFGHYICFTKDFSGNWYMIDDCKVIKVELEEVLSQGAYMLLYSRLHVRQPKPTPQSGNTVEHLQLTPVSASSDPVKCVDTAGRDRFPIYDACPENKEKCDMDVDEPGTSNFSNLSIHDVVSTDLCERVTDDDVPGALSSDIACQEVPEEVDIASEESSLGLKEPEEGKHSPRILFSCKLDEDSNFIVPVDTTNCSPVLSTCSVNSMQENFGENATPSICSPKIDHAVSHCVPSSSSENTKNGLTSFHDKGTSSLTSGSLVRSMRCEEKPLFPRGEKPLFPRGFLDKASKKKLPSQSKQVLSIRNGNKCSASTGSLAVVDEISEPELHSDFSDKYDDGEVQYLVRNSKVGHSSTHDNSSSNYSVSGAAEKTFGDRDPCQQAGYTNGKNNGLLTKFHGNPQGSIDVPAIKTEEIGCPSEDWSRSMGKSLTRETKNDGQRYDFFQNAVGEDGLTFCQFPRSNGFLDKLSQDSQDNNGIHVFKEVNCTNTTRNDMPKKFNMENCEPADENSLKSDACEKDFSCSTGNSSGAPLLNESHHGNKTYINDDYAGKKSKPSIDISSQRIAEPTEQGSASFRVTHYGNGIGEPSSVRT